MANTLQAAVLSNDASMSALFREATANLNVELVELNEIPRYIDLVSQEPFDLLLIDCEGSAVDQQLISTLRERSANREAVLMIAAPHANAGELAAVGASVVLTKPLDVKTARKYLQDAIRVIFQRQRIYARHPVEMEVLVSLTQKVQAKAINLGEGGIALQLAERIEVSRDESVRLSFDLPPSGEKFETSAKLAWMNNDLQAAFAF